MRAKVRRNRILQATVVALALSVAGFWILSARRRSDPDRLWRDANLAFAEGHFEQVESALTRLERLRRLHGEELVLRARAALARGRVDDVLAEVRRIPEADPAAPGARLMAGQALLRKGRLREAEGAFLAALALDPKLVQAHRELIFIYGMQLRRAELHAQFIALRALVPLTYDNVFHWCLMHDVIWEPARQASALANFVQADPADRWSRLALAEQLRRLNRCDEAEDLLAALPASDLEALAIRAQLAMDSGDAAAAAAILAQGPEDHPALARLRGRQALAHHNGPEALRHYRAASALDADQRDTLFGLGRASRLVGDDAAADRYFEVARRHDFLIALVQRAANPTGRQDLALLKQLGAACESLRRFPEARAWFELAIARDPLDAEAQKALFRLSSDSPAGAGRRRGIPHAGQNGGTDGPRSDPEADRDRSVFDRPDEPAVGTESKNPHGQPR
jgi:tetratricopeptide (TPR) repeat protein